MSALTHARLPLRALRLTRPLPLSLPLFRVSARSAAALEDPVQRMLSIVRWYVSGWHIRPKLPNGISVCDCRSCSCATDWLLIGCLYVALHCVVCCSVV